MKGVANRFILDQDIAIAAMGDTQMLPGGWGAAAGSSNGSWHLALVW